MNSIVIEVVEVMSQNKTDVFLICSNVFLLLCLVFRNRAIQRCKKERISTERERQGALLECKAEAKVMRASILHWRPKLQLRK